MFLLANYSLDLFNRFLYGTGETEATAKFNKSKVRTHSPITTVVNTVPVEASAAVIQTDSVSVQLPVSTVKPKNTSDAFKSFMAHFKVPLKLVIAANEKMEAESFYRLFLSLIDPQRFYPGIDPRLISEEFRTSIISLHENMEIFKTKPLDFAIFSSNDLFVMLGTRLWQGNSQVELAHALKTKLIEAPVKREGVELPNVLMDKTAFKLLMEFLEYDSLTESEKLALYKKIHICDLLSNDFLKFILVQKKENIGAVLQRLSLVLECLDRSYLRSNLDIKGWREGSDKVMQSEFCSNLALVCAMNTSLLAKVRADICSVSSDEPSDRLIIFEQQVAAIKAVCELRSALDALTKKSKNMELDAIFNKLQDYPNFDQNITQQYFYLPTCLFSYNEILILSNLKEENPHIILNLIKAMNWKDLILWSKFLPYLEITEELILRLKSPLFNLKQQLSLLMDDERAKFENLMQRFESIAPLLQKSN